MAEGNLPNPNVVNNYFGGIYDGENIKDAIKKTFDAITITGVPVVGYFADNGTWMYIAYKYPNGLYGMMLTIFYNNSASPIILNVVNGVYSYRTVNTTILS